MAFDTWLEQDIRSFLDNRMTEETRPQVTRLEDTESIYSNKDWKKEIAERLKQGDDAGAKQLFSQLRLKYLGTPKDHEQERTILYAIMQDCYIQIANHVLSHWHTQEILRRMDTDPENVFDENTKPVDLSDKTPREHDAVPDLPQITTTTAEHIEPLQHLKESGPLAMPERDKDAFSFDPETLVQVAKNAEAKAKASQAGPSPIPHKPKPVAVKPAEPPKPSGPPPELVNKLREALELAKKDPKKAAELLAPLVDLTAPQSIRGPAAKLLEGIQKHLDTKTNIFTESKPRSPRELALIKAKATAAAYERTAKRVHDEMAKAAAFARARDTQRADEAMVRARALVEELEREHPAAAKPLRERLDRSMHILAHTSLKQIGKHAPAYYDIMSAITAIKRSITAKNHKGFHAALATLEHAARAVPEEHKQLITETIRLLRERARKKTA